MKVEKDNNVWDKVASTFGQNGPKYWLNFGKKLVEFSSIKSGSRVLDIGMGRGSSLFPAIDKVGTNEYVVGIDNSEVMVFNTYKEILERNVYTSEVKNKNAVNLDFDDASFDNVICGFGIGYLLLSESKLNGILRILKNDGQVGFSIWGIQEDQKWLTEIINKYLNADSSKETSSKKSSHPKFDNVIDVKKILADSGFHNIKVNEENSVVVYKDKEEWWEEMWSNAVRGIFERIEELGHDKFKEFKVDIFNGLENFNKGDGFYFNMPVIYAYGEK